MPCKAAENALSDSADLRKQGKAASDGMRSKFEHKSQSGQPESYGRSCRKAKKMETSQRSYSVWTSEHKPLSSDMSPHYVNRSSALMETDTV